MGELTGIAKTIAEWTLADGDPPLSEPFLIREECRAWPAFEKLTFDFLRDTAGSTTVPVRRTIAGGPPSQMALAQFLDYCQSADEADPLYLVDWKFRDSHPEILNWMDPPPVFSSWLKMVAGEKQRWNWLYIGPRNSSSPFHVDNWFSSGWNAVFSGLKEWRFVPADDPFSVELQRSTSSGPPKNIPREEWTAIQRPGDIVHVPSGWAHAVVNRLPGIAYTENFVNEGNYKTVMRLLEESGDHEFAERLKRFRMIAALRPPTNRT